MAKASDPGPARNNYSNTNYNNSYASAAAAASQYDATLYNFFDGTKYSSDYGYSTDVVTYKLSNGSKKVSKSVVDIIGIMFNEDTMKRVIREYSLDPTDVESNRLSNNTILKALKKLSLLGEKISGSSTKGQSFLPSFKKKDPYADFVKLMKFTQPPTIKTIKEISYYNHALNDLLLMKDAYDIIKEHNQDQNFFYKYYKSLQTKIRPVEDKDNEYNKVLQYTLNSHGPTHSDFKLEVIEIFKISRRNEFRKYRHFKENYGLPKLLWYGTRATNIPSILLNGIQLDPQEAPTVGNMFGKGIYFSDCASKAAKKCQIDRNNPIGLLVLAEVALGKTLKLTKGENISFLRNGKHSVKGLGKFEPDPNGHLLTKSGVQVPYGKQLQNTSIKSELNYNEYVVHNTNQILLQYLVKVKFHFK